MQSFGSVFTLDMSSPRLRIIADVTNPKAVELVKKFPKFASKQPNMFLVIGGDGFMLDVMHKYWQKGLPFFGINAGHRGFLLNDPKTVANGIPKELKIYNLPMLDVEILLANGKIKRTVAFNDVWVERAKSQAAWIEVKVNGVVRLPKLVADSVLLATATGSTAYARAIGAWPLPLDAQSLVLVGSGVCDPIEFRPCYIPIWSNVEFKTLDPSKRPLIGVVDGHRVGRIVSMRATVSKTSSVQLANVGNYGLPEKLLGIQFPPQIRTR